MKKALLVIQNILTRRSVRQLKSTPIPDAHIDLMFQCLEAAPSAGNLQPWFFYAVKKEQVKKKLCQLSFDQKVIEQAHVVFVICAKPDESAEKYGDLGRNFFCIQDTAAAVQNLLLAVHAMGYGAVWIGVVQEEKIRECLALPVEMKPVALVPVGLPNEKQATMERKGFRFVSKIVS